MICSNANLHLNAEVSQFEVVGTLKTQAFANSHHDATEKRVQSEIECNEFKQARIPETNSL